MDQRYQNLCDHIVNELNCIEKENIVKDRGVLNSLTHLSQVITYVINVRCLDDHARFNEYVTELIHFVFECRKNFLHSENFTAVKLFDKFLNGAFQDG